jgi:branched-chain amino acid transport system permease protein
MRTDLPKLVRILPLKSRATRWGRSTANVQTSYAFDSFLLGPLIIDATKVYAGGATLVITAALFAFFRFAPLGKAIRACADNYTGALVVGLNCR